MMKKTFELYYSEMWSDYCIEDRLMLCHTVVKDVWGVPLSDNVTVTVSDEELPDSYRITIKSGEHITLFTERNADGEYPNHYVYMAARGILWPLLEEHGCLWVAVESGDE